MTEKKREKKILLVEDEPHLAFNLELNLKAEGFSVRVAADGATAFEVYEKEKPFDLILLDVMLPELNGFQLARLIRSKDIRTSIIMVTARSSDEDRIRGLELGVDDYITKPFHLQELVLKVKRATERSSLIETSSEVSSNTHITTCGPFRLDNNALTITSPNGKNSLTALEADVLLEFMKNPDRVLSRDHLLEKVWGMNGNYETRSVDNFVMRLRKLIEENPSQPKVIESVRGRGYRFNTESTQQA